MSTSLREQMPNTAAMIDSMRAKLGKDAVDAILRRAMKGEEGCFCAYENGHMFGMPNTATTSVIGWDGMGRVVREDPDWIVHTRALAVTEGVSILRADPDDLDDVRREARELRKFLKDRSHG